MAHTRKSSENDSTRCDKDTCADPIDPRAFGLAKAAYAVGETLAEYRPNFALCGG
jgi:hypothetical protein